MKLHAVLQIKKIKFTFKENYIFSSGREQKPFPTLTGSAGIPAQILILKKVQMFFCKIVITVKTNQHTSIRRKSTRYRF